MNKRLTQTRLVLAVISTSLEEVAIWAIWRWLLPGFGINLDVGVLVGIMVGWGIFSICFFVMVTYILKRQKQASSSAMVGASGEAVGNLTPEGMVKIRGELWSAVSEEGEIASGEEVVATGEKGLKLLVRRLDSKR